jgi:hypothetical protein
MSKTTTKLTVALAAALLASGAAMAQGLTRAQVRAMVDAASADERRSSVRHDPEAILAVAPAPSSVPPVAAPGYDESLRRHGPVTRMTQSPAREVVRSVRSWAAALPADWRPSSEDVELIREAIRELDQAARRVPASSDVG